MNSSWCATDRGSYHGWWHTIHLNLIENITVFDKNRNKNYSYIVTYFTNSTIIVTYLYIGNISSV